MDKAIEIKRRAQRFVQSGDLDSALGEYQKLVTVEDSDPYNFVLLADLLYKKSDRAGASERYLHAVGAYEKAGLYKNAIAVCKKMMRLSLSPPVVLKRLGSLHALDGLATEASLYYQQYAEHLTREGRHADAAESLRLAFEACSDSVKVLERAADALELAGKTGEAARAWADISDQYRQRGAEADAGRCASRAEELEPGVLERRESEAEEAGAGKADASGPFPAPDEGSDLPPEVIERNGSHLIEVTPREAAVAPEPRVELAPEPQSLRFDPPAEQASEPGLEEVEALLHQAESEFQAGDRESAGATLLRAAEGYEHAGRAESAVAIYRSLSRSALDPETVLTRWLANAESRSASAEAAEVAGQLGETAVAAGDWVAAQTWFERALTHDPGNDLAQRRLQRLRQGQGQTQVAAPAAAEPGGKVSLATGRSDVVPPELDGLLAEFQKGVESHIAGDAQSRYDLAMTYREMGFVDQAIEGFREAGRDRAFQQRCAEMIGRCFLDQGRFEEAIAEFEAALTLPVFAPETLASLRFQLGLAHEAAGRTADALEQFEQAYAAQPNYPDAAQKIRQLRRVLEQS